MIKIIYPPGCYGNYLARCIYNYTNLRTSPFEPFEFGVYGNNHCHQNNIEATKYINRYHIDQFVSDSVSTKIAILPDNNHRLDYTNNQFFKAEEEIVSYIKNNFQDKRFQDTLKNNWGYDLNKDINESIPTWVLREWISFWLEDSWNDGYNRTRYAEISSIHVEANHIIESFDIMFMDLIVKLNLTLTVDLYTIMHTHNNFCRLQKFCDAQLKCNKWIYSVINQIPMELEYATIFDESYIQQQLRSLGYEIYCNNLNKFPLLALDMKELIYKV